MSDPMCRACGGRLVFSARARGNGLCGPCTREGVTMAEAILGAIWVAAVQANRRASFRKRFRITRGLVMADVMSPVRPGQMVTLDMVRQLDPIEVDGFQLHELEVMLGYPPRGLVPPDLS